MSWHSVVWRGPDLTRPGLTWFQRHPDVPSREILGLPHFAATTHSPSDIRRAETSLRARRGGGGTVGPAILSIAKRGRYTRLRSVRNRNSFPVRRVLLKWAVGGYIDFAAGEIRGAASRSVFGLTPRKDHTGGAASTVCKERASADPVSFPAPARRIREEATEDTEDTGPRDRGTNSADSGQPIQGPIPGKGRFRVSAFPVIEIEPQRTPRTQRADSGCLRLPAIPLCDLIFLCG